MAKKIFFTLVVFYSFTVYSQVDFEKGYIITNSNQKVTCLIRNFDRSTTPFEIAYKISETEELKRVDPLSIKEFGIGNSSKYISSNVQIDKSSDKIDEMSHYRDPEFVKEQLFLKVLLEGKSNLYIYEGDNFDRFFYTNDNKIEQLVYKSYLTDYNKINKYTYYKQQLWTTLKCPSIDTHEMEQLEYDKKSLIDIFVKYNKCNNSESATYDKKEKKELFNLNLTLRPRFNFASMAIKGNSYEFYQYDADFGSIVNFGFGAELEYIIPYYRKNKWALIIEPIYQQFKGENSKNASLVSGGKIISSLDYKSFELSLGGRHYMFLNSNSKIFINVSYVMDFAKKTSVIYTRADGSEINTFPIKTNNNIAFGLGYKFKDKYSVELRVYTAREILNNNDYYFAKYHNLSLILGYSFF